MSGRGDADAEGSAKAERSRGIARGSDWALVGRTARTRAITNGLAACRQPIRAFTPLSDRMRARLQHLRLILCANGELGGEEGVLLPLLESGELVPVLLPPGLRPPPVPEPGCTPK